MSPIRRTMILSATVLVAHVIQGTLAFVPHTGRNQLNTKTTTRYVPNLKRQDFSLSNEKLLADPVDPQDLFDVLDIKKIVETKKQEDPLVASVDIVFNQKRDMSLDLITAASPNDVLSEMQSDVADHVKSIFPDSQERSTDSTSNADDDLLGGISLTSLNNTTMTEDVKAVLEASSEAVAAAEASLPQDIIEQLEFSSNVTTLAGPIEINHVPEILSASSVVGEPVTATKIEPPAVSKILKFAIPAIGVWLCGPLLSLIDTSAVGVLSGTIQQAALNPAVAVTDYAALLIAFMYTGTTNLVAAAQASDRSTPDKPVTTKTLIGAMRLSSFVGAGLGAILFVFARPLLKAIIGNDGISPAVFDAAMKYVRIRSLGMPAAAIIGSTQAACLGMQDIRSPLYVLAAAAIVNFFGDMFFVGNTHPLIGGAAGAAWATVISQYAGVALFVRWLCHKPASSSTPRVVNVSKAILEMTGKPSSDGGSRRKRLRETLQSFSLSHCGEQRRVGKVIGKIFKRKDTSPMKAPAAKAKSFTVRGFLHNKFSVLDLMKPPSAETRKEFAPYLVPVTTTQVGRVSGYVAMSHVVASSLGFVSMAAQQVIVSIFYCLCPIADSLSLTAQSFLPSISERKASPERAAALRQTTMNFMKAGAVFGGAMMAAVSAIPLISGFFTSDPAVVAMVNAVVPLQLAFFAVHGVLCAAEGLLLGQKDLSFLGKMYAGYFAAVPYLMLKVKKAALTGSRPVNLTSVWQVFVGYQMFRCVAWVARVAVLQKRVDKEAEMAGLAP